MEFATGFTILSILALLFGFLDGFHNSANIVATAVSSRAMHPRQALTAAALAEFIGPFLFGTAVAKTIGSQLVNPMAVTAPVVAAATLSATVWKLITWRFGIPASSSHSLIGGLVGGVMAAAGLPALQANGLITIFLALFLSPLIGLVGGYLMMNLALFLLRGATPKVNTFFKRGQIITSTLLALIHGSNNSQKVMGIIVLGLVSGGVGTQDGTPLWIVFSAAGALAAGTFVGGMRIIRTIGGKFYKIRPIHGFTAQVTTATIILVATLLGGPVSTTQVVSSSVVGVGASERMNKVRWQVFQDIALAWLITLPFTAFLAAFLYWCFSLFS